MDCDDESISGVTYRAFANRIGVARETWLPGRSGQWSQIAQIRSSDPCIMVWVIVRTGLVEGSPHGNHPFFFLDYHYYTKATSRKQ